MSRHDSMTYLASCKQATHFFEVLPHEDTHEFRDFITHMMTLYPNSAMWIFASADGFFGDTHISNLRSGSKIDVICVFPKQCGMMAKTLIVSSYSDLEWLSDAVEDTLRDIKDNQSSSIFRAVFTLPFLQRKEVDNEQV